MMILPVFICSVIVITFSNFAFSAPSISGISGVVQNGNPITISGSGFGSTGPTVILYDSFEKGTTGSNISTVSGSADIGNWNKLGNPSQTYATDYALSGSKAMKIDWASVYGAGPEVTYSNVQNSDLLVSWWQYMPTNRDVPGTNNSQDGGPNWKWFWIGDKTDDWPWGSDYSIQCLNTTCSASTTLGALDDTASPARFPGRWYTPLFGKGTWMRVTIAMKNATSGGYAWQQEINGSSQLIAENATNVVTAHSSDPWNVLTVPGFGRRDSNAVIYYDDVYVATGNGARARVEIGNASTYAACTRLSLLTPTSWGDASITATVRTGSFPGGAAYLFVVDSLGVASPGTPIIVGSSQSTITCYHDADNDLYGHGVSETVANCSSGYYTSSHFTALTGDCNDNDALVNPGGSDICGTTDRNCDNVIDPCPASSRVRWGTGAVGWGTGTTGQ